jgi:hypothetical protein
MDPSSCDILAKTVSFSVGMIFTILVDGVGWGRSPHFENVLLLVFGLVLFTDMIAITLSYV